MSRTHRWILKVARLLHVYLTLFGFALLLFFAITGFLLNHEADWELLPEAARTTTEGTVPVEHVTGEPNQLLVVERLRGQFHARGALNAFEIEPDELRVIFKAPGYLGIARIQREDGKAEMEHEYRGLMSLFLDLHRGKESGKAWSLLIDAVSILFVIVAMTGLVLWSSLKGRAQHGLLILLLGTVAGFVVYFLYVPR